MDGTGQLAVPKEPLSDNVIGPREAPWLIVDAKYKNPLIEHYGCRFHNEDLYQAFTYASALDAPAVLVYPRVDWDVDVTLKAGAFVVRIKTVDLRRGEPFKLDLPGIAEPAECPAL